MKLFGRSKREKNDFSDFPVIGGLMVSKMVTEKKMKPLFMYREKRANRQDSGWRIFSGFETQEFADDPNNTGIYNPSTILQIDSTIADLLLSGVGSIFERQDPNSEWYRVTGFELDDDHMIVDDMGDHWVLEINNLFEKIQEDNGDLLYTTGDKSVRIAIWDLDGVSTDEWMAGLRRSLESKQGETLDFSDETVTRIGYETRESYETMEYDVIYGYSIVDDHVAQLAFYYDDPGNRAWAMETWKSVTIRA